MTNARVGALAAAATAALARCRALALTCRLVDLRYDKPAALAVKRLVLPVVDHAAFASVVRAHLTAFAHAGGRTYGSVDAARVGIVPAAGGIRDATLLLAPDGKSGILDVLNTAMTSRRVPATLLRLDGKRTRVSAFVVAARSARDIPLGVVPRAAPRGAAPHLNLAFPPVMLPRPRIGSVSAKRSDVFRDGSATYVLENHDVRVVISADAGARSFVFEDLASGRNAFTPIGALRDDTATPARPSTRDYIAAYTHPIEAGTFNREYDCKAISYAHEAEVRCTYTAPDLAAAPIRFEKTFALAADARTLTVTERASADAVSLSAISATGAAASCSGPTRCTLQSKPGYTLLRAPLPANTDVTLRFSTQGSAPAPSNPR
jgi:hypothetical protein